MNKHDLLNVVKVVCVLCCLSLIAGVLLGTVHHFTEVDEAEKLNRLKGKMTTVYPDADSLQPYVYEEYKTDAGEVLHVYYKDDSFVIHSTGVGGYGGTVELLVLIENNIIKGISCYSNGETPGVGSKALTDGHFSLYVNKDVSEYAKGFASKKNGGDIDFVTGATKSSTAVNNAVNVACSWYTEGKNEQ